MKKKLRAYADLTIMGFSWTVALLTLVLSYLVQGSIWHGLWFTAGCIGVLWSSYWTLAQDTQGASVQNDF